MTGPQNIRWARLQWDSVAVARIGRVPQRRSRLVRRLLALQLVTVLLTVGGLAALGVWGAQRIEFDSAGRLTEATAAALAGDPDVVDALARGGDGAGISARMQPLAERIRAASGTGFVVVMSTSGRRYSHAEPDRIGGTYLGTLGPALAGLPLTEIYTGTLGPSVRTVVPVFSGGRVVGAVSVGVLQTRVSDLALRYLPEIVGAAALALVLGSGLAWAVARRLRRQTLGLEPDEITAAYTHHDAVLHAVGEGLLVIDADGRPVVVNAEARRLLGLHPTGPGPAHPDPAATNPAGPGPVGGSAGEMTSVAPGATGRDDERHLGPSGATCVADLLVVDPAVRAVLERGRHRDLRDEPALAGERVLLVNSRAAGAAAGPGTRVFTLRDRTELAGALRERDDARDRVAALSGQAHEFANRMQTVITLMELGDTVDATRAGMAALDRTRGPGTAVTAEVFDPVLAALLADKAWAADELDVGFTVTDDHRPEDLGGALGDHLPWAADDLVSLAGNLVDNALEAVTGQPRTAPDGTRRAVAVTIAMDGPRPARPGSSLVLRVSDTGPGIPADTVADLFTYGFSTRGVDGGRPRGIGLALVDRITRRLGGTVEVSARTEDASGNATGTVFTVRLPFAPVLAANRSGEPDPAPTPSR